MSQAIDPARTGRRARREATFPAAPLTLRPVGEPRRFSAGSRYAPAPDAAWLARQATLRLALEGTAETPFEAVIGPGGSPAQSAPMPSATPARSRADAAEVPAVLPSRAAVPQRREPVGRRRARERAQGLSRLREATQVHRPVAAAAAVAGLVSAVVVPAVTIDSDPRAHADSLDLTRTGSKAPASPGVIRADGEVAPVGTVRVTAAESASQALPGLLKAAGGDPKRLAPSATAGMLQQPVTTVRITSRFGARPDPWGGSGVVGHIGQDYGIQCGTPVYAAAAGKVVQAEPAGHSGLRVRVDHGNGLSTTYNHNSALTVKVGDTVEAGDQVSLSGTTGNSTGCHLHFEVYVNDVPVDPANWV